MTRYTLRNSAFGNGIKYSASSVNAFRIFSTEVWRTEVRKLAIGDERAVLFVAEKLVVVCNV